MKKIAILGSTGSIGRQALEVVTRFPDRLQVTALAAGSNYQLLAAQARAFRPSLIALGDERQYASLKAALSGQDVEITVGTEALSAVATQPEAELVLAAISGSAGLPSLISAIEQGKEIALANKESLVAAGSVVIPLCQKNNVRLLPVDSEHSAIFQCLQGETGETIENLILTASGGPFRTLSKEQLAKVQAEEALRHPTWQMGAKITIDSASLANKGLEVIEAHWLFAVDYDRIEVVIHPESVVNSLVRFTDGSLKAKLSTADMRLPIQYACLYPERPRGDFSRLDLQTLASLHFEKPDLDRFPALSLAYQAGKAGDNYPIVYNAANEELALAFLAKRINFGDIAAGIEQALQGQLRQAVHTLAEIMAIDNETRETTRHWIGKRG